MSRRPLVPGLATVLRLSARAERASVVAIALIAAVSSFVLAASARATDEAARRSVVEAVERAADGPGRLTFTADRAFASGGAADPLGPVSDALAAIAEEVPPAVDRLYEPPRAVLDTQRFLVVGVDGAPSPLPTRLTMRVHPDLDEHLAGPTEALADAGEVTEVVVPAPPDEPDVGPARLPSLDIGLTATTADELGVGLGSIWTVDADDTDALSGRIPGFRFPPFALRVARILEPTPPTERYWYGDARLHRPVRVDTGVGADLYVYAAVEPEDLVDAPFVDDSEILLTAIQRYDVDLDVLGGLGLDELDEARSGLDAMAARFPEASTTRLPGLETRLAAVLEDEADQIRIADAMRLLGSVGLVGVLGGLAATVLLLGMMRRAAWTAVARSRGGGWSITAAEVVETTLAVLVGTAVGLVAARLAVTDVATTGDRLGAALVAVVLITCRVAVSVAAELGGRVAVGVGRLRHAGPVAFGLLAVVAAAGVVVVRQRGFSAEEPWRDPALVLLPVLVPLVVGLAAAALVGPLAGLAGRGGLTIGVGGLVGFRRLVADVRSHRVLLVVTAMAVATVVIATAVASSIARGAEVASWRSVGAPYRIETTDRGVLDAADVELAPAPVAAGGVSRVSLSAASRPVNVQLHAVDTGALAEVRSGSPAHAGEDRGLADLVVLDTSVVPATTAPVLDGEAVEIGDELRLNVLGEVVPLVVTSIGTEWEDDERDWVVVDRNVLEAASGAPAALDWVLVGAEAPQAALDGLAERFGVEVADRAAVEAALAEDPLVQVTRRSYLAVSLTVTAGAALALGASMVLAGRSRRRQLALLDLLGARPGELRRAALGEILPPVLLGVVTGVVAGLFELSLFADEIDITPFAGGVAVRVEPDVAAFAVVAAALIAASIAVALAVARSAGDVGLGRLLREEGAPR